MNLAERTFEGCRIYAAASDIPGSNGFHGAVVVMAGWSDVCRRKEVFRDECLENGRVWLDPQGALAFALQAGQSAIVAQRALTEHRRAGLATPATSALTIGAQV